MKHEEFKRFLRDPRRLAAASTLLLVVGFLLLCLFSVGPFQWGTLFASRDRQGLRLFAAGDFEAARERFSSTSWKACAAYRGGEFELAASLFAGAPGPESAFGRGNAQLMQGKYEEAIEGYDRALELRPEWPAALTNRTIAAGRAARLEREGGEGTGGQLEADEIVFTNEPNSGQGGEEEVSVESGSAEEVQAMWLRQVQTTPSDFLRTKFAYQLAFGEGESDAQ